ncbi:MAG: hypothetical protein HY658_02195 [Actinobacteria bacterium]|nr:hypothetical protein [Actinomycetota bacterium]
MDDEPLFPLQMEDSVWRALRELPPDDYADAYNVLDQVMAAGPGIAGAIETELAIRGKWVKGYQVMLLSGDTILTFAPVKRDGETYIEVAHPIHIDWEYRDE